MANSRSSDWSNQQPGGRFGAFQGTGRGHIEQEPPYYLNGYEHEGYEEQLTRPRESEELAHDDGYLGGWEAWSAYPGAEPDCAGPDQAYLPPTDPWDTSDNGYAFPAAGAWDDQATASRGASRDPSRSQRTLWMAAIAAVGLVATVLAFRWAGEAEPADTPAVHIPQAAAHAGGMDGAGTATPSYRLIAAKRADGFSYNATASHRMATAAATAGGATGLARCLEAKGLTTGGTVAAVRYAQYNDGKDVTGLSLIGFGGTFGPGAARRLWQAAGDCGALASGAAAASAAPGPDGGTLYTGTGNPAGTTCVWATGTTAALVWFFNGMTGLTVRDPAAACQAVRSAVEARLLCRTYACCARA